MPYPLTDAFKQAWDERVDEQRNIAGPSFLREKEFLPMLNQCVENIGEYEGGHADVDDVFTDFPYDREADQDGSEYHKLVKAYIAVCDDILMCLWAQLT